MVYKLFHKNIEVLTVEYEGATNKFGKILDVMNEGHIPPGIENIPNHTLSQSLQFWWQSRLIPKNRSNFKINNPDLDLLLSGANGFNLSDQYWIKEENSDMTWEKGNFYTNTFNEDIGEYITGVGKCKLQNMSSSSPDLFSNGQQDKRWVIERGRRLLVKYGRPPYYEQPFNEMLASEICRRLDIPHVQYSFLVKGTREPFVYSMCPCFVDTRTEFVPAGFVQYALKKHRQTSNYNHLLKCCRTLGMRDIESIEKSFAQMNVLDYLVANTDRHYGNFGFIRNAETLEWEGCAPNFDTGNAMFYEYPTSDLRKSTSLMDNVVSRSFVPNMRDQAVKMADKISSYNFNFNKLDGIKDYYEDLLSRNPKEDAERIHLLSSLLVRRIENLQELVYSKNSIAKEFLQIVAANDSDMPLMSKIDTARNQMEKKDSANILYVDKYLKSIVAKDLSDYEKKFNRDIEKILKGKNRDSSKQKSLTQRKILH